MTKKYESMTELDFLELVHESVYQALERARRVGRVDGVPTLTEEQFETISFESSFNEHRIVFYPEENRQVTLHIRAEEYQFEEDDE